MCKSEGKLKNLMGKKKIPTLIHQRFKEPHMREVLIDQLPKQRKMNIQSYLKPNIC